MAGEFFLFKSLFFSSAIALSFIAVFKDKFKNTQKLDIIVNKDVLTFSFADESNISTITLYDLNGNKISVLTNYNIKEGENSINLTKFNTNLEKGRYFLVIENNNNINTGKFIYLK